MSIGEMWRRLAALVRGARVERDVRREMQLHLELLAEEARDEGAGPGQASDAARRRFGSELSWREACREATGWASLDRLAQDVRIAARALRRDARFTAVAVLVLALGIGGNTIVFSLVHTLVLDPFPYPRSDRLVEIQWRSSGGSWASTARVADFGRWREHAAAFEAIAAYGWSRADLTAQSAPGFDAPERIVTGRATEGFLRVLGVRPALGRFFTPQEDSPGGPQVAVLSYGAWMRRFGGRPGVLGETMTLDGVVRTIVGVMPARLVLPGTFTCEAWVPAAYDVAANMRRGFDTRWDGDNVIARLRPTFSAERAGLELGVMSRGLDELLQRPARGGWDIRVIRLGSDLAGNERPALRLLALVVGIGLLLACANLAGLLLARSTARAHEAAVRASLGASRLRLVRYALTEALLVALAGGTLGVGLAWWGIALISAAAPPHMGLDSALRIDAAVLGFTLGLSVLTSLAFGLVPAIQGSKAELTSVLKGVSAGGRPAKSARLLSTLVVAEVSLALLLLVGAGLTARSLARLTNVNTGIRPEGVLTCRVSLSGPHYGVEPRRSEFFAALVGRLRRVPGVVAAAAVSPLPMSGEYSGSGFRIEGRAAPANDREMMAQFCQATPGYFHAMGIPVVLGREFEDADGPAHPALLVNEALARRFFPGEDPIGHRLARLGPIVGVVGDVHHNGPAAEPNPQIYYPASARPGHTMAVVARTTGDPMKLAQLVRREVAALDRNVPVERMRSMTAVVRESMATPRMIAMLVGGFGLFALALAGIGLYGLVAYSVNQRRREIGLRMALGASRATVVGGVVRRGARLAAAGLAIGMPLALGSVRLMAALLYGLSPYDPLVLASTPLVLLAVSLFASYLPARRAAGLDPLSALRTE